MVVQNHTTGKWSEKGVISESRTADDGTIISYTVLMDHGGEVLRNKRFIKHNIWISKKKVRFADQADEEVNAGLALSESN